MNILKSIALAILLSVGYANAACNDVFLNQKLPQNVKYNQELCYTEYTVLYNYQYKIPMISAEHLTPDEVKASATVKRKDAFHVDSTVPVTNSQKISSYVNTGYDKGHMTPAGDMSNPSSQMESFSMANMTPQAKKLNEIAWRKIETEVRNNVLKNGPAYVLTGSLVSTDTVLKDGIVIPDYIFKAVYFNQDNSTVYVAKNDNSMQYVQMTVAQFEQKYGIVLFTK